METRKDLLKQFIEYWRNEFGTVGLVEMMGIQFFVTWLVQRYHVTSNSLEEEKKGGG